MPSAQNLADKPARLPLDRIKPFNGGVSQHLGGDFPHQGGVSRTVAVAHLAVFLMEGHIRQVMAFVLDVPVPPDGRANDCGSLRQQAAKGGEQGSEQNITKGMADLHSARESGMLCKGWI